jgi:hypothetical protein
MPHFPVTPAETLVLPAEDLDAFRQLRAAIHAEYCAATPTELFLVEEIVQNTWRIRRFRQVEAANLATHSARISSLTFIERAMAAAERACHRALAALTKMQRARGFVPAKSQPARPPQPSAAVAPSGFVSQKTPQPPAASRQTGFVPAKSQPAHPNPPSHPASGTLPEAASFGKTHSARKI